MAPSYPAPTVARQQYFSADPNAYDCSSAAPVGATTSDLGNSYSSQCVLPSSTLPTRVLTTSYTTSICHSYLGSIKFALQSYRPHLAYSYCAEAGQDRGRKNLRMFKKESSQILSSSKYQQHWNIDLWLLTWSLQYSHVMLQQTCWIARRVVDDTKQWRKPSRSYILYTWNVEFIWCFSYLWNWWNFLDNE